MREFEPQCGTKRKVHYMKVGRSYQSRAVANFDFQFDAVVSQLFRKHSREREMGESRIFRFSQRSHISHAKVA